MLVPAVVVLVSVARSRLRARRDLVEPPLAGVARPASVGHLPLAVGSRVEAPSEWEDPAASELAARCGRAEQPLWAAAPLWVGRQPTEVQRATLDVAGRRVAPVPQDTPASLAAQRVLPGGQSPAARRVSGGQNPAGRPALPGGQSPAARRTLPIRRMGPDSTRAPRGECRLAENRLCRWSGRTGRSHSATQRAVCAPKRAARCVVHP